jgi:endonuclease/exonuclease/phosphatase family metal-dependent hydrolase
VPDSRPSASLRIATFNVENLGKPIIPGATLEERIRLLRPQLLRLRADVLCLQEVDSERPRGGGARRLSALDALLADTPYQGFHRASTVSRSKGGFRDKHNLVILSRLPIGEQRQILHDLVSPPLHRPIAAESAGGGEAAPVEWDRPVLHAAVRVNGGPVLHVVNVHLRAPRAAFVAGQKADAQTWRSMSGWAEGFFLAAVKRAGQALEVRLLVDRLFDADADALIVVRGDFNADVHEVPVRTIRGDEEDAGNPHLAPRMLVPVERSLADSRRFSVVHHGRPQMLDHLLVSRPLLAWYRSVEIHNEALGDELVTSRAVRGSPESFHAPVVAEFGAPEGAED